MGGQEIVVGVVIAAAVAVALFRMLRTVRSKDVPDCGCGKGKDCKNSGK